MARNLVVEIVGDSSSLDRSFKKAGASADQFGRKVETTATRTRRSFAGIGKAGVAAFAGIGVTAAIKSTISTASDLEQQISKTDVVFGQSAAGVEAWSKTLVESFGLSRREALATASGFGALFAPMGLVGAKAAEQSEKLTELGADLASFYNTDVASALDAVRSGIVGESEPLRRYGVQLSEVRVQQEALRQTGKTHVADLTVQEKTLARIAIIWKDTSKAQGDFGRTAETAANQAKIFAANMENLKAAVGTSILPALTQIVTFLNTLGPALNKFAKVWREFMAFLAITALTTVRLIVEPFSHLPGRLGGWARRAKESVQGELEMLNAWVDELNAKTVKGPPGIRGPITAADVAAGAASAAAAPTRQGLTKAEQKARLARIRQSHEATRELAQERAAFAVERATATKTLDDDLAALNAYNALLLKRIGGGHKTLALEREQFQVQTQIAGILEQQAEAAKEAAKARRDARQFRLLGFGPTGEDIIPGVKGLKRQLAAVNDALAGSFLDTRKTRGLIAHIRQVLAGGLGSVSSEVRARIKEILDDLRQQLKQSSVDVTKFQQSARGQLTLAGAHPAGQTVVVNGGVHLHGVQNVAQMENELAKRSKQRAHARRATR